MNAKCMWLFLDLYAGIAYFENGFMEFIIDNDVSIICLKCVDCF
jgi:hypothetical protein